MASIYHTNIESQPSPTSKQAWNPKNLDHSPYEFIRFVLGLQTIINIGQSKNKSLFIGILTN